MKNFINKAIEYIKSVVNMERRVSQRLDVMEEKISKFEEVISRLKKQYGMGD